MRHNRFETIAMNKWGDKFSEGLRSYILSKQYPITETIKEAIAKL